MGALKAKLKTLVKSGAFDSLTLGDACPRCGRKIDARQVEPSESGRSIEYRFHHHATAGVFDRHDCWFTVDVEYSVLLSSGGSEEVADES